MCVKTKKKNRSSTVCKSTEKSGITQVIRQAKNAIAGKCRSLHIALDSMELRKGEVHFHGHTTGVSSCCPCCGTRSRRIHSYRLRKIQCSELLSNGVVLYLRVRHFHCGNPACERAVFSEPLRIAARYGRSSREVSDRILHESVHQPALAASNTLRRQHIIASPSTCLRSVARLGEKNPDVRTSGYVGIDDFAKRKGHDYMCAIVDHYTRRVLAVFDSRYGDEIRAWIASHPEIRLVSRDGSRRYRELISSASAGIIQVSDRFHLMQNLMRVSVDIIKEELCERKGRLPYPYPSEEEAFRYIRGDILSMGDARQRNRVGLYYQVRSMKDAGMSIPQIAMELHVSPRMVYRLQKADVRRILSDDQRKAMKEARRMAQIASGCITPEIVARKMGGTLPTGIVCRAMRTLAARYAELRRQVREHNRKIPQEKTARIGGATIWSYVLTGKTSSQKLMKLAATHTAIHNIIGTCIDFRKMIHGERGAPDVDSWIRQAGECHVRKMTEFAEYIRTDKEAVKQACLTNYSNAVMEGTVNKIKTVKRTMYNRANVNILRAKAIYGDNRKNNSYHLN